MNLVIILLALAAFQSVHCANILGIFPTRGRSHYIVASSLMRGLAEKGHNVTVIASFEEKTPPKNGTYKNILITHPSDVKKFDLFALEQMNFVTFTMTINFMGNYYTEAVLSHPKVQELLMSDQTFDVVIVEQFVDDALKVFAYHYKAPLVLFIACGSHSWINPLVGNPGPPSYVPEQNIHFRQTRFLDRLRNTIVYIFGELNRNLLFFPQQEKIMKMYFSEAPALNELVYNASLVLLNSHWSTNMAVPRVPNMVDLGGIHVKPPQVLPQDLKEYLDGAKEGVIYFNMGSVLQSVNFPVKKREAFIKVFAKLKQKVLWKWEGDVLPNKPANVRVQKWMPQQDILGHPNIKAFVTHGGLLSLIESVYHGVPILAVPVYGDQVWNSVEASTNGLGSYVLYGDLNEDNLEKALKDVLHNPRYRQNMKVRSKIMRDRRHKPIDDADYWIQYVIRYKGAAHLKVPGLQLPWYQYLLLDVALFMLIVVLLASYLFYYVTKIVLVKLHLKVRRRNKDKRA